MYGGLDHVDPTCYIFPTFQYGEFYGVFSQLFMLLFPHFSVWIYVQMYLFCDLTVKA